MEYSEKTIEKFLKQMGADEVSEEAVRVFGETLELFAGYITEEAVGSASKKGSNVITKEEIEKALE